MNVVIRQANEADLGYVILCVCQAFIHYIPIINKQPQPMLDDYNELIAGEKVIVAVLDDKIAGVMVLGINDEGFCIETLAVYPVAQGAGIGSQLIAFAEKVAKQSGFTSLNLSTNRIMNKAQLIYKHLGFEIYDERITNGYDRVYFRKMLA